MRNEVNLDNLSNHCIAGLNSLAFRVIKSGRLNKLVDKRAVTNEGLYKKLEKEASTFVKSLDFSKLYTEN